VILQKTKPCNVDILCEEGPAPKDCMLTSWSDWSHCDPDVPARATQRYRSRSVAVPGSHGGATCETSLQETENCEESDRLPPVDCRLSEWTAWELCDKTCEGGQSFRSRSVEVEAQRGGRPCEDSKLETQPCNEIPCSLHTEGGDCALSQWSYWSDCSTTCGQGLRQRSREVLAPAVQGGIGCNAILEEANGCFDNPPCDAQDCEWGMWTQWSECSKTCDGGQRSRHRSVFLPNSGSGRQCEAMDSVNEIDSCGTKPCSSVACEDGLWHDWGEWGQCSRACGGGMRWRHRKIAMEASSCGSPAVGEATEEKACNEWKCEVDRDCKMSDWTLWSSCSASCDGQQVRKREVSVQGSGNGKWCLAPAGEPAPLQEVRSCNGPEDFGGAVEECGFGEAQDCLVGSWSSWSVCSRTCGGGIHVRKRTTIREARLGGKPCSEHLEEVEDCSTEHCGMVMDCVWDDWAEWGGCSRCDGEKIRIREIRHLGNHLGAPCESSASREVAQCNDCPKEKTYWCIWADWTEDGSCSATCGTGGKTRRQRMLMKSEVQPQDPLDAVGNVTGDNAACEAMEVDYTACKDVPVACAQCVPEDCEIGDWTDWEEPTNCDGLCTRLRKVKKLNNDCGMACNGSLRDTKSCLFSDCQGTQECTFSHWSAWSGCPDGASQQFRVREIATQTGPLGKACAGPQKETKPCEVKSMEAVSCEFSTWSMWGNCSKVCGGGQQERSREVAQRAHNAAACNGSMRMTRPCGEGLCTEGNGEGSTEGDNDCALGDWSEWMGCDKGDAQGYRTRSPVREARNGGLPCSGITKESGPCQDSSSKDCVFSDWAPWGSCGATCGGGQRFRTREVLMEAQPGGVPCSGDTHETQTCNEEVSCNIKTDCVISHWSLWSSCSVSCGQGQFLRQRKILQAASPDGVGCNFAMLEVRGCMGAATSETCGDNVNCVWGEWQQWSDCQQAEYCGLGFRTRSREIAVPPRGHGERCDPLPTSEVKPDAECAKSCVKISDCIDGEWGNWGAWGACSVTCGQGGTRKRVRTEKVQANHCGVPPNGDTDEFESCDAESECETELGKQDCVFGQWSSWQDCSASCNGARQRTRAIATYSAYGGLPCEGAVSESQRCNPGPDETSPPFGCQSGAPVDCEQLPFSQWSDCSATCGTGFQSRKREVAVQPAFGGKGCENPLQEIKECNATEPCVVLNRDCKLSDWQGWGDCDVFTAQRKRTRFIEIAQAGFGKACQGNLTQVEPCQRICEDKTYFCGWGDWQPWSRCSMTCGPKGRRTRSRSLLLRDPDLEEQASPPGEEVVEQGSGASTALANPEQSLEPVIQASIEASGYGSGSVTTATPQEQGDTEAGGEPAAPTWDASSVIASPEDQALAGAGVDGDGDGDSAMESSDGLLGSQPAEQGYGGTASFDSVDPQAFQAQYESLSKRLTVSSGSHSLALAAAFFAGLASLAALVGVARLVVQQAPAAAAQLQRTDGRSVGDSTAMLTSADSQA